MANRPLCQNMHGENQSLLMWLISRPLVIRSSATTELARVITPFKVIQGH